MTGKTICVNMENKATCMTLEGATGWPGIGHRTVNNIHVPSAAPPLPSQYPWYPPPTQPPPGTVAFDAQQAQQILADLRRVLEMLDAMQRQNAQAQPSAPLPQGPAFQPAPYANTPWNPNPPQRPFYPGPGNNYPSGYSQGRSTPENAPYAITGQDS